MCQQSRALVGAAPPKLQSLINKLLFAFSFFFFFLGGQPHGELSIVLAESSVVAVVSSYFMLPHFESRELMISEHSRQRCSDH